MTKKLNLNNKKNGGNEMKKVRVYAAAKELGVSSQEMMMIAGKHHWLCTITAEKFNKIKEEITMEKMTKKMKEERNEARGGKEMKKYLINITKYGDEKRIGAAQATAYNYLSGIVGFKGADITFAYTGIECNGRSYFDIAQEYTKVVDDQDARYNITVYEYTDGVDPVNIHDGGAWVELCNNIKLYITMQEAGCNASYIEKDIDQWTDVLLSGETTGEINEAIFVTGTLPVARKIVCVSYEEVKGIVDELANVYDLILDKEEDDWDISMFQPAPKEEKETKQEAMAHILSLEDEEWDLLKKYLDMDKHGFIYSKKSGRALTYKELMISLDWVNKRRA